MIVRAPGDLVAVAGYANRNDRQAPAVRTLLPEEIDR